ncbi:hypothetical protein [Cognataquiflexum rubidum]|uniref:hypothetical protein n=1 Tax=Cognataquiflexum rubidum TaxID=2922273 RepID=UPI001F149768|nr:hypothetical protein [Cognataquiflexum rubidum]MCH6234670.1 hypothetical protein [Cognataquiflexum rubidum]
MYNLRCTMYDLRSTRGKVGFTKYEVEYEVGIKIYEVRDRKWEFQGAEPSL